MQLPTTWDAVAPGYAEEVSRHTEYAEEALRIAAPSASARVLDVGCGPGILAFVAAPQVARVDAVDFSPGMIEQVRARCSRDGVQNVHAAVMDAQSLGFADQSFDAAFSLFAFMFVPDRARAFRELHRVLKPGGRVVIATWGPIERRPLMKVGFDALAEALPELPPQQKGDLQQPDECIAELSAAGFRDVDARAFSASVHAESPDRAAPEAARGGSLGRRLAPPARRAQPPHSRDRDRPRRRGDAHERNALGEPAEPVQ
jgi:ubiquinone/menaquinone biosynthesis C-methylase UbiE